MAETKTSTTRRLNWRAAAALAALILALGGAALALHLTRPGRIGGEAARQVERLVAEGRAELALRHLGRYLQRHPDDQPMRFLQARLLADRALAGPTTGDLGTLGYAAGLHQQLLRQYPAHPESDDVRARLAELYLRLSDTYRLGYDYLGDPEQGTFESRYRAAAQIARELIARRGDDPRAHGLLGRAQEGLAGPGSRAELRGAVASYERALALHEAALRRDPDDVEAAGGASEVADRLARLHRDRRDDPEAAEAALARLVAARPESVEPRLVRYRHYREARDERRAAAELEEALRIAPGDPMVLLAAADHELHRGDPASARDRLAAIPEGDRRADPLQRRLMSGMIEYAEQQPIQAMEQWREGLVLVRGAHAEMSWWLAYVLILEGRLDDAGPLIDQYRRLTGGGDSPRMRLLHALREERLGNRLAAIRLLEDLRRDDRISGPIRQEATLALGRCHEAIGDREQAERIFRLAMQADARSASPVASHARLLLRAGRFEEAARLVERALGEQAPDDPDLLALLVRVRLAEQGGLPPSRRSWAAFDRAADRAAEVMPDSVELALMRADRYALGGLPDEADAQIEAALRRSPADPRIWATSAELLTDRGRPDEALRQLDRGREAAGDGAILRLMQARILVSLGRGREAQRRLIEGGERLSPAQQADLWEALGRLRMAQADFDGADLAFDTWARLRAGSPGPILARIEVALLGGRVEEAQALLERLEGKDDLPYRLAHASILLRLAEQADGPDGDRQRRRRSTLLRAFEVAEGVVADARELAEAHLLTGRILEALGRLDEAASSYRQAWQRGDPAALPPLTDLLARLGRFDELEQMVAASGADRGLGRLSAQALLGAGEVDRAARLLNSAVDDPNAPASAHAWRARMLALVGRLDELEGLLRREAERAAPDDPAPWIELIAAQARLGRDRAALDVTVRRALDHASRVPAALLEARLRWAAGDAEAADDALEAALDGPIADPGLVIGAASYYQETGRPDRAEPLLERLMDVEAAGDSAALQLAILLSERAAGDPAARERALELVGPEGDDPDRRLARAVVLAAAPDPDRRAGAIPLFEGLLADLPVMHPRAVEARGQLAHLLLLLGRADRAAQVTAVSAGQPAPPAEALTLHVRALLRAGRLAEADAELDRLELIQPGDPEVAELRAERLLKGDGGDPKALERAIADRLGSPGVDLFARAACLQLLAVGSPEAIEAAGRIAGPLGDRSPGRRWIAGLVEAIRGRPDEALRHCSEAARSVDFTDRIDWIGLRDAVVLAAKLAPDAGRAEAVARARPIIASMLLRRPGDPDLLFASAFLSHLDADYAAEADLYRQVLRRRPGDPLALHNLALVLSEGLDRPDEALEQIDRLAARVGPTAGVLGTRGVILTRLGRFDEAIRDLGRAIELEPSADRYYYLARAYHKAGRDDQFRAHLERARRSGLTAELIDRWQHDELRRLLSL